MASSGALYEALKNPSVAHIQVMADVTLSASHFAVSGLALPVDRDVELRACHPSGGRYQLNLGCLGAALLVSRHRLRLSGDLQLLEVGPQGQQVFPGEQRGWQVVCGLLLPCEAAGVVGLVWWRCGAVAVLLATHGAVELWL